MKLSAKDIARFRSLYTQTDGCWEWQGEKNEAGRARVWAAGSKRSASHVALHLDGRPRPSLEAAGLHDCDNPGCVNPSHLWWGLQVDNVADRQAKGRGGSAKGDRHGKAKLRTEDVLAIRADTRTATDIARQYGVCVTSVSNIRNRETWGHV